MSIAMHMSDGLINAPTAILFWVVAAIGLGIAGYRARADLNERTAPMAGLVAAFVFAVQMNITRERSKGTPRYVSMKA